MCGCKIELVGLFVQMLDTDFALYVIIVTLERKAANTLYFACDISSSVVAYLYKCFVLSYWLGHTRNLILYFVMYYFGNIGQTRKQSNRMYTAPLSKRMCSDGYHQMLLQGGVLYREVHALGRKKQAVHWGPMSSRVPVSWSPVHHG